MRRVFFAVILVAMLGVGLAVGSASLAAGGSANPSKPMVIKLISRATAINNFVDTGPPGLSAGDLYVYSDRLFLASAPNEQLGTIDGRCVLIDPASLRFDCSNTGHIPEGEPLAAGDIQSAGTLTLVQGTTSTFAIVGGTWLLPDGKRRLNRRSRPDGRAPRGDGQPDPESLTGSRGAGDSAPSRPFRLVAK